MSTIYLFKKYIYWVTVGCQAPSECLGYSWKEERPIHWPHWVYSLLRKTDGYSSSNILKGCDGAVWRAMRDFQERGLKLVCNQEDLLKEVMFRLRTDVPLIAVSQINRDGEKKGLGRGNSVPRSHTVFGISEELTNVAGKRVWNRG